MAESPKHEMTDPSSFNAEELRERKNTFNGYKFCPRCAQPLNIQQLDGRARLVCGGIECDFIYYHNPVPAAGVVVFRPELGVLLVKRAHPPMVSWWCLPAGYMEGDESRSQCAVRETREETGLDVEITGLFGLYSGDDDPRTNAVLALYDANVIGGKLQAGDDAYDARYFPLDSLPEKIAFVAHNLALDKLAKKLNC
jgi:8-oxo-dGTP diphosphatase